MSRNKDLLKLYNFTFEDLACMNNLVGSPDKAHLSLKSHRKSYKYKLFRNIALWKAELSLFHRGFVVPDMNTGKMTVSPHCAREFMNMYNSRWMLEYSLRSLELPEKTMFIYLSLDGNSATILTNDGTGEHYSVLGIARSNISRFILDTCGVPAFSEYLMNGALKVKMGEPVPYSQYRDFISMSKPEYHKLGYERTHEIKYVYALLSLKTTHGSLIFHPVNGNLKTEHEGLMFFHTHVGGYGYWFPNVVGDSIGRNFICSSESLVDELGAVLDRLWPAAA